VAKEAIRLGFYISFAGNLTYANAAGLKQAAGLIPIDRTLIETDCPYLTPQPYRGKRNEPARVRLVADHLAQIHRLSLEDVARITTRNAVDILGLERFKEGPKIAYKIRDSLYLNITNECTLDCVFCAKRRSYKVKGHFLKLEKEPSLSELLQAIGDPTRFNEVVFCGFGEPLLRLDTLLELASKLKRTGVHIRIDTDGLANLVHGRNILPELAGLIDSISVSLNAENAIKYARICPSPYGEAAYQAVKDFIRSAKEYIPEVTATAVTLPSVDIDACRRIAEQELGVKFRSRMYNEVG
jgi:TatD DNase family protein